MRYKEALYLQAGDKVRVKKTGDVIEVAFLDTRDKGNVFIRCDDGVLYHHTALVLVKN